MQIESRWIFACEPRHVWPHFLHARMDGSRPLLFRLGVPKPMSCRVLEGVAAVGNTRQCTTDRGTIDQRILELESDSRLRYEMKESTVWCGPWVAKLIDTFELRALGQGRTEVRRLTQFEAAGACKPIKLLCLWLGLRQAHAYASRNWRRLALASQAGNEANAKAAAA
jgi:hypothetical protein